MNEICVVHLVRAANGLKPFEQFIESYKANPAGIAHDLLLVFKGFTDDDFNQYLSVVEGVGHLSWRVPDEGFDLNVYFMVAQAFEYKYFCFTNSYSVILDKDWLAKLYRYASCSDVGLVGATGSYESMYSNNIPGRLFSKRRKDRVLWKEVLVELKRWLVELRKSYEYKLLFDKHPNYHIRTNGFMISRSIWMRVNRPHIFTKMDAHRFESGKSSLTKQVMNMGKKVLVVGKDGQAYEKDAWRQSNTFRTGDQSNLLIADNQTNNYQASDNQTKMSFENYAWGEGFHHVI